MPPLIIAIDGPSGAGKGTVARAVAARLGLRHVDSGAMYRAVGWKALHEGVALDDEAAAASVAARARIEIEPDRVSIDGVDITREIRTPEIDRAAASVARLPRVREVLVARQQAIGAQGGGLVMEGRDIGTVVFPRAAVKIYLDAAPEERARRRASDPAHGGSTLVAEVVTALAARDELDRTRKTSPLYQAVDAELIDTTGQSVDQVVDAVLRVVEQKRLAAGGWD